MNQPEIFNAEWFVFLGRFFLNLIVIVIISRFFYFPNGKGNKEYLFTYISTSIIVFIVCILIGRVKVELGIALGLFAVFSLIRFRSAPATPRELTYLFICMGVSIENALLPMDTPFLRMLVNTILILSTIGLADYLIYKIRTVEKDIVYDNLELLSEGKESELETDLNNRFGIKGVMKIQVGNIDTLKGRVKLRIRIRDQGNSHFQEK